MSCVITFRKLYIGRENCYILQLHIGKERGQKKVFEEIMAKIFPNLKKPTDARSSPYHKQYKHHTHTHTHTQIQTYK